MSVATNRGYRKISHFWWKKIFSFFLSDNQLFSAKKYHINITKISQSLIFISRGLYVMALIKRDVCISCLPTPHFYFFRVFSIIILFTRQYGQVFPAFPDKIHHPIVTLSSPHHHPIMTPLSPHHHPINPKPLKGLSHVARPSIGLHVGWIIPGLCYRKKARYAR